MARTERPMRPAVRYDTRIICSSVGGAASPDESRPLASLGHIIWTEGPDANGRDSPVRSRKGLLPIIQCLLEFGTKTVSQSVTGTLSRSAQFTVKKLSNKTIRAGNADPDAPGCSSSPMPVGDKNCVGCPLLDAITQSAAHKAITASKALLSMVL